MKASNVATGGNMFRVMSLFAAIVLVWGLVWLGAAYLITPYIGEQLTIVVGTLLGFVVGAVGMTKCIDIGWSRGWIKW